VHGSRVRTHRSSVTNLHKYADKVQNNRNVWWIVPVRSYRSVPPIGSNADQPWQPLVDELRGLQERINQVITLL
jgi:hypothetical protein